MWAFLMWKKWLRIHPLLSPWSALVTSECFGKHWFSAYITRTHHSLAGDCLNEPLTFQKEK